MCKISCCSIPGCFLGFLVWLTYRRLPSAWLVEYGETAIPPELGPQLRSPFLPDGLFLSALSAGLVQFGWLRIQPLVLYIPYLLASFLMMLILIADWKPGSSLIHCRLVWRSWRLFILRSRPGCMAGLLLSWVFVSWPESWPGSCFS